MLPAGGGAAASFFATNVGAEGRAAGAGAAASVFATDVGAGAGAAGVAAAASFFAADVGAGAADAWLPAAVEGAAGAGAEATFWGPPAEWAGDSAIRGGWAGVDGAGEFAVALVARDATFGAGAALTAGCGTSTATSADDATGLARPTLAVRPRLWPPGEKAGGRTVNSPASSAVVSATTCPWSVTVTLAFGAARPAITASPDGSTRTISNCGGVGSGSGAGAADAGFDAT